MSVTRYSENPEKDIWKKLLKYSFGSNVKKASGIEDDVLVNAITGSIVQAHEYFNMANSATLNTSPLLMYYGCVNLLFGTVQILQKSSVSIKNHGAQLKLSETGEAIGESVIHISSSEDGAYFVFNKVLSNNNPHPQSWSFRDILSYIPELKHEFESCYSNCISNCVPIEIVKRRNDKLERICLSEINHEFNYENIVGFKDSYHIPQKTNEYIILREKLRSREIGILSISGQKNLILYSKKDDKNYYISHLMALFLGLYTLSVLSRYHPGKWHPFVQRDDSGEKGLIEDFLSVAARVIPNIALNLILGIDVNFKNEKLGYIDFSKDYDEKDIKKIVKEEIRSTGIGQ